MQRNNRIGYGSKDSLNLNFTSFLFSVTAISIPITKLINGGSLGTVEFYTFLLGLSLLSRHYQADLQAKDEQELERAVTPRARNNTFFLFADKKQFDQARKKLAINGFAFGVCIYTLLHAIQMPDDTTANLKLNIGLSLFLLSLAETLSEFGKNFETEKRVFRRP